MSSGLPPFSSMKERISSISGNLKVKKCKNEYLFESPDIDENFVYISTCMHYVWTMYRWEEEEERATPPKELESRWGCCI